MTADPCTCTHGRASHLKRADYGSGACMHRQDGHPRTCPCRLYVSPGTAPPPVFRVPGQVPWAVTTGVHLNGRLATDWEAAALAHARECEHGRDAALLAGVLTEVPVPRHEGRTVTDLAELS